MALGSAGDLRPPAGTTRSVLPNKPPVLEIVATMSYFREKLLAAMDLGSSSASGVNIGALARRVSSDPLDAGGSESMLQRTQQRYMNPAVVFEHAAWLGRDEFYLVS